MIAMKKLIKGILFLVLLISIFSALYFTDIWPNIKNFLQPENLKNFITQFGIWAPIVFMALYYSLVLAFISATAFTVLSGLLFGKVWGTIYVIIAATLAAQTAFFITRKLGPEKLRSLKQKKGIGKLITLVERKCAHHGFKNLFILRCLFAPYIPLSYAAGMIHTLKPRDFFFATFFTNLIFSPAFVFLGDSLLAGPKALFLPIIMISLVLAVPKIIQYFSPHHNLHKD